MARDGNATCEEAMAAVAQAASEMPGAWIDHPWGETVYKAANKKVFVFLSIYKEVFRCTTKLPHSAEAALTMFSFCSPTGYGLGASGWVTSAFPLGERVPLPMLIEWMQESYTAVAGQRAWKKVPVAAQAIAAKLQRRAEHRGRVPVEGKKAAAGAKKPAKKVAEKKASKPRRPAKKRR